MPRTSCPYCNSTFDAPATGPAACPRCGESLPGRGPAPGTIPDTTANTSPGRTWPILLGLVVAVAAVAGGLFALGIFRDRTDQAPPPLPGAPVVPPARVRGLDYLPPSANVVFVIQPAAVFRHAGQTAQNPAEILQKAGVPPAALATLGSAGVSLDNIDHVAGGVFIPDADLTELRFTIAVVLLTPLPNEDRFLDALKARRPAPGEPHQAAEFAGLPVKVAKAADTVWLIGWSDRDVVPAGNGLSGRMKESLAVTFPDNPAACILTDSADWAGKKSVALLLGLGGKADWQPGLEKVRAVAAGYTLAEPPTVRLLAQGATPGARDEIRQAFRRQRGTPGEAGEWITLDAPADRAGGLPALRSILAPK